MENGDDVYITPLTLLHLQSDPPFPTIFEVYLMSRNYFPSRWSLYLQITPETSSEAANATERSRQLFMRRWWKSSPKRAIKRNESHGFCDRNEFLIPAFPVIWQLCCWRRPRSGHVGMSRFQLKRHWSPADWFDAANWIKSASLSNLWESLSLRGRIRQRFRQKDDGGGAAQLHSSCTWLSAASRLHVSCDLLTPTSGMQIIADFMAWLQTNSPS